MKLRTLCISAGLALAGVAASIPAMARELTFSLTSGTPYAANSWSSTVDGVSLTVYANNLYANLYVSSTGLCVAGWQSVGSGCNGFSPLSFYFDTPVRLLGYEVGLATRVTNNPVVKLTPLYEAQWSETDFALGIASFATQASLDTYQPVKVEGSAYTAGEGIAWNSITVETVVPPVPVPASGLLLGGLMLAGAAAARRKRS